MNQLVGPPLETLAREGEAPPAEPARPNPIWHRLFDPVDIAPLVYFRIIFVGIMLWECWRYYSAGWIDRYWIDKPFHFTYYGFGWVKPWPGDGMYYHFGVMAILSACIILGYRYRLAAPLFFLAFTQMFLLDQANHLNHFYMVCLVSFLIMFLPLNRAFSVDSARNPAIRTGLDLVDVTRTARCRLLLRRRRQDQRRLAARRADAHVAGRSH
jgi:vitamin K-dependent gamma-carboxylase